MSTWTQTRPSTSGPYWFHGVLYPGLQCEARTYLVHVEVVRKSELNTEAVYMSTTGVRVNVASVNGHFMPAEIPSPP